MVDEKTLDLLKDKISAKEKAPDVQLEKSVIEKSETANEDSQPAEHAGSKEKDAKSMAAFAALAPTAPQIQKDPLTVDLEHLLADDLTDVYLALSDSAKLEFKQKGEEIVFNIKKMIETGKIKARRVLELIRQWLRLVPGINVFFLEQEAKIKADSVLKYANDQVESKNNRL